MAEFDSPPGGVKGILSAFGIYLWTCNNINTTLVLVHTRNQLFLVFYSLGPFIFTLSGPVPHKLNSILWKISGESDPN
jgi:hypothetical protein